MKLNLLHFLTRDGTVKTVAVNPASNEAGCTRVEHLNIVLSLNRAQIAENENDIRTILERRAPVLVDGENMKLVYNFDCAYFGEVERKLSAVNRLLSAPGLVATANVEELNHNKSILVSIVQQIEQIRSKLTSPLPLDAAKSGIRTWPGKIWRWLTVPLTLSLWVLVGWMFWSLAGALGLVLYALMVVILVVANSQRVE